MDNYKLIYFTSCPNYLPALELVKQTGVNFDLICQDDLEETNQYRNYSSPTFLKNSNIVFGSIAQGGGCSVQLPSQEQLNTLIQAN